MKIILHFGMPKSGSTAIQHRLSALRTWLLEQGLYYPEGLHTVHNHSLLVAAGLGEIPLPRHYRKIYGKKTARAAAVVESWFDEICLTAEAQRSRAILLSAETLFRLKPATGMNDIGRLLARSGGEICSLAYLRKPSDFYLSAAQQKLKASHNVLAVEPLAYRPAIERVGAISEEMRILPFDRGHFPQGDIFESYLSELGSFLGERLPSPPAVEQTTANVSIGAEGMALLQSYRRAHHAEASGRYKKDSTIMLEAIAAAEQEALDTGCPYPKSRLRDEVARYIDQSATDLPWLRERFDIVFPGVDYDAISAQPAYRAVRTVRDICTIDDEALQRLTLAVMRRLALNLQEVRREETSR